MWWWWWRSAGPIRFFLPVFQRTRKIPSQFFLLLFCFHLLNPNSSARHRTSRDGQRWTRFPSWFLDRTERLPEQWDMELGRWKSVDWGVRLNSVVIFSQLSKKKFKKSLTWRSSARLKVKAAFVSSVLCQRSLFAPGTGRTVNRVPPVTGYAALCSPQQTSSKLGTTTAVRMPIWSGFVKKPWVCRGQRLLP